jgi:hypothetical protein
MADSSPWASEVSTCSDHDAYASPVTRLGTCRQARAARVAPRPFFGFGRYVDWLCREAFEPEAPPEVERICCLDARGGGEEILETLEWVQLSDETIVYRMGRYGVGVAVEETFPTYRAALAAWEGAGELSEIPPSGVQPS